MTRIRQDDTSPIPAAARRDEPHTHPMPTWAKVLFAVFAASVLLSITLFYVESRARDAAIIRELDRRTQARDAEEVEQGRRVNAKLCRALEELPQTPGIVDLAEEFRCV